MTRIKRRFGEGKLDQVFLALAQQFFAFLGREVVIGKQGRCHGLHSAGQFRVDPLLREV